MQLSKTTIDILKNFSSINSNLVVKVGKSLETISPAKDIIASFTSEDEFSEQVAVFNLNESLGVLGAFENPELDLDIKSMLIKQGKQRVKYNYADESLLIVPPEKGIKFPGPDITFDLTEAALLKLQKMSAILSAEDLAVIGNGKKITLKVFDKKNPSCNEFELDTEVATTEKFQVSFKIEKLKLMPGNYNVEISKKMISRFTHDTLSLVYFVAVEQDSAFN